MLYKRPLSWQLLGTAALVLGIVLATAVPAGAHVGDGGDPNVVHACVGNVLLVTRIVGPSGSCLAGRETAVHWSIQGPPGPQGATGPQGPQGPAGPPGGAGPPLALTVDCGQGGSIANALANNGAPLIVTVLGTCTENVTITRDDVTLQGDPATAGGVTAANPALDTILIDGARRVVISNLTVSGGQNGIVVARGTNAIVRDSTVQNSTGEGIRVMQSSHALIHHNLVERNAAVGVLVIDGSSATITLNTVRLSGEEGVLGANSSMMRVGRTDTGGAAGNTIEENTLDGVSVTRGSAMELRANTIKNNGVPSPSNPIRAAGVSAIQNSTIRSRGGNTVQSNGADGIFLRSSNLRTGPGDLISNNSFSGIAAVEGSTVDLRDAMTVSGNGGQGLFLEHGARLLARNATISGNGFMGIVLRRASTALLVSPLVTVTGNGTSGFSPAFGLFCEDSESSFDGAFLGEGAPPPGGAVSPGCTGFGQVPPGP